MRDTIGVLRSIFAVAIIAVAFASASAARQPKRVPTAPSLPALIEQETVAPITEDFPSVVKVMPLTLAGDTGWRGVLADRYSAEEAFEGEFRIAFIEGLKTYLRKAGFQIGSEQEGVQLLVTMHGFEGRRRGFFVSQFGGDLRGTLTLSIGGMRLLDQPLLASYDAEDDDAAIERFDKRFGTMIPGFVSVLFYRLSMDYYQSIAQTLAASGPAIAEARERPITTPSGIPAAAGSPGSLIVLSEPSGAEVYLGNRLVGTTPTPRLPLVAGDQPITLRLSGFAEWHRTVTILVGGEQIIQARMEKAPAGRE